MRIRLLGLGDRPSEPLFLGDRDVDATEVTYSLGAGSLRRSACLWITQTLFNRYGYYGAPFALVVGEVVLSDCRITKRRSSLEVDFVHRSLLAEADPAIPVSAE